MRPVHHLEAPDSLPERGASTAWVRELDLTALTPIYKGGADPDGIDESYPFRGPTIRGQLRTWWRATQDTTNLETLRLAERDLFGGVFEKDAAERQDPGAKPRPAASLVRVGLSDMSSKRGRPGLGLKYAVGWVDGGAEAYHLEARGRLRVEVPGEHGAAMDRALRAWLLLGGVGSRSRRGLGKVWTTTSDVIEPLASADDLLAQLALLMPTQATRPWPSLSGLRIAILPRLENTATGAVAAGLTAFQRLRGMKSLGGHNFSGEDRAPEFQQEWLALRNRSAILPGFTPALGMPLTYRSSNGHLADRSVNLSPHVRGLDKGTRLPSPVLIGVVPVGRRYQPVITLLTPWSRTPFSGHHGGMPVRGTTDPRAVDVVATALASAGWQVHALSGGPA